MKHVIDCETLHNWENRWENAPYFADLPAHVKADIRRMHDAHHQGKTGLGSTVEEVYVLVGRNREHLVCAEHP